MGHHHHHRPHRENWKELYTILLALRHFADKITDALVFIHSDSATAVSYANHGAGSSPPLARIGREIKLLEISISCFVVATHVAGADNTVADSLSRLKALAVTITSDELPLLRTRFWTSLLSRAPALRIVVFDTQPSPAADALRLAACGDTPPRA